MSVSQHKDLKGECPPPVTCPWCKLKVTFASIPSIPVGFFPRCKQEKAEGFVAAGPELHRQPAHKLTHMNTEKKATPYHS